MIVMTDDQEDMLLFFSGFLWLFISVIFVQLYQREKRRDYFLLFLGFLTIAISSLLGELDSVIGQSDFTESMDTVVAICSSLLIVAMLVVLIIPDKLPLEFRKNSSPDD